MRRALAAAIGKDLRMLGRSRVELAFLALAPIVVITITGFSLASLYGVGALGKNAYIMPVADEDEGRVGRAFREALARSGEVVIEAVPTGAEAAALIEHRRVGVALVIPRGASRALATGKPAAVELLTDPAKQREVARARALVHEISRDIERRARGHAERRLSRTWTRLERMHTDLTRAAESLARELDALPERLAAEQAAAALRTRAIEVAATRELRTALARAVERQTQVAAARLAVELEPLQRFLSDLDTAERAFGHWWSSIHRVVGRVPPPPALPGIPFAVRDLVHADSYVLAARLVGRPPSAVPGVRVPTLTPPTVPALPALRMPPLSAFPAIVLPGTIAVAERSTAGARGQANSFGRNVLGIGITFLLLGMLLGASLGLVDEQDWGTLARLRTMPAPLDVTLLAKLLTRCAVGGVQMISFLIVGRIFFGISLGAEPWALALPTAGIVFAGATLGLVGAGLAHSRAAALLLGVIVTVVMAAVGGCWWPLDLEPHWMQRLALAFPTTWAMAAYDDLMIRRQPLGAALVPTGVLLAHGLAYLCVGIALFRRRFAPR
ncbi:MAG: hypothetical protein B6D46_06855 [Polyangiaceae bacterium UTPRO1]|nr:ABC transporter permease [Myxococcales bacterium]OQY67745.1 MAG: hypothetical protein B6D46_06855 [Polyangiaceae bacterium UTPRO1]